MNRQTILLALFLFVIGFGLYAVDLNNILFLDDETFIVSNEYIREFSSENVKGWFTENVIAGSGGSSEYYRPLLLASFAVSHWVHGVEPFGYHLVNNILHSLNAILVMWLMLITVRNKWLAFLTALIFLIHPMQAENVAFAAARGDIQSGFFMLAGLIVWVRGIERGRHIFSTFLSSVLMICALLSRENGIVFPFLALTIYIAFLSREHILLSLRKAVWYTTPFFLIMTGYFALRLTVLNFRDFLNFGDVDVTSIYAQHLSVRLYTFLHALVEYLRTYLWPTNVHLRFDFPVSESIFDWPVWLVSLSLVALAVALVVFYRKERCEGSALAGGDSHFRMWFFAWGWFFAALAPGSGIIPTNAVINDHRLYLAMISISAFFLWYGWKGVTYMREQGFRIALPVAGAALAVYLCFLSWMTVDRAIIWGKPIEFFEEILRYEPDALAALAQLGMHHVRRGEYTEAEIYLREAILKGARFPSPYNNMGLIYQKGPEQDHDVAIMYFTKALEIRPQSRLAHRGLAEIYMKRGDPTAIQHLEQLHERTPDDANIHYNLAAMLHFLGRNEEALRWVDEGLMLTANNAEGTHAFEALRAQIVASENTL